MRHYNNKWYFPIKEINFVNHRIIGLILTFMLFSLESVKRYDFAGIKIFWVHKLCIGNTYYLFNPQI